MAPKNESINAHYWRIVNSKPRSTRVRGASSEAFLSRGSVVTIYSEIEHESFDLDFVTSKRMKDLTNGVRSYGWDINTRSRKIKDFWDPTYVRHLASGSTGAQSSSTDTVSIRLIRRRFRTMRKRFKRTRPPPPYRNIMLR